MFAAVTWVRLSGALLVSVLTLQVAAAHPTEDHPPDARPQAMGGAFTAIAEGPFATCWNPAGLALTQPLSFSPYSRFELRPMVGEAPYGYAFGATGHWGRFGLGACFTTIGGGTDSGSSGFPSGRTLWLGGGVDLSQYLISKWRGFKWGVGGTLKHISELSGRQYGVDCSGIPTGWALDLGTVLSYRISRDTGAVQHREEGAQRPTRRSRYRRQFQAVRRVDRSAYLGARGGLLLRNLLSRKVVCVRKEAYRPLHPSVRVGIALEAGLGVVDPFGRLLSAIFSLEEDIVHRRRDEFAGTSAHGFTSSRFGAELSILGMLAARGGWIKDPETEIEDWSWGLGVGIDLWKPGGSIGQLGARLDFASLPTLVDQERSEHWTVSFWVLH